MIFFLISKNKQGFIDETCNKGSLKKHLHSLWDHCNALVLSWIVNSVLEELVYGILYSKSVFLMWNDLWKIFNKINGH